MRTSILLVIALFCQTIGGQVNLLNAKIQNAQLALAPAAAPAGISISSTAWKNNANEIGRAHV